MRIVRSILRSLWLLLIVPFIIVVIVVSWNKVGSAQVGQNAAGLVLAAATFEIGIALTVLKQCWSSYHKVAAALPSGKARLKLNLKDISDRAERDKYETITALALAVFLLAISIFCHLVALLGMGDIMLGLQPTQTTEENYQWGLFAAEWGLLFFFTGMYATALAYGREALAFMMGKRSLLFGHRDNKDGSTHNPQDSDSK